MIIADTCKAPRVFSLCGAMFMACLATGICAPGTLADPEPALILSDANSHNGPSGPAVITIAGNDPEATLGAVARYQYGGDRKPLQALEQLVLYATSRAANDPQGFRESLADRMAALLTAPGVTPAAQVLVCHQLGRIATEKHAAALNGLLTNQPIVAAAALGALQRIPGPTVDRLLSDALASSKGELRMGVVAALGTRRSRAAVEPLIALLTVEDQALAGAVAEALGQIGGDASVRALQQALVNARGRLRKEVAAACLVCADRLLAQGQTAAAAALYQPLSGAAEAGPVRLAAWRGLVRANPEIGLGAVCAALTNGDPALVSMAVHLVPEVSGAGATEQLTRCLDKAPGPVQALLLGALAARGDLAAHGAVQAALSSPDSAVRLAAIRALGTLGDVTSVKPLIEWTRAGAAKAEGKAAEESLVRLRGPRIDDSLTALVAQDEVGLQVEVIRILAARNAVRSRAALEKATGAADQTIRRVAWKALGSLARNQDAPALLELLRRARDEERENAERALSTVLERPGPSHLPAVLQQLDAAEAPTIRASLLRVISAVGDDRALPALRQGLESGDAGVREAAVRGLANWPTVTPYEDLLDLARTAGEPAHRILAQRAAIRLCGKVQGRTAEQMTKLLTELMSMARGTAERKTILAELARYPTPEALALAQRYLADPELAPEASAAVTKIGSVLRKSEDPFPPVYTWKQTGVALTLLNHGRVVWQWNHATNQAKPFFHPIALPDGTILTAPSPADHPWHRGLWFSWKMLNGINYWEEDPATGKAQGLTEMRDLKSVTQADGSAHLEMELSYRAPGSPPVLTEKRLLEISPPDPRGAYRIDWRGTFIAGEQAVRLQGGTAGGGYAGLSVRVSQASSDWVLVNSEGRRDAPTDGDPNNSGGLAANTHGQRARWADFSMIETANQQPCGIAILAHPSNPRHPPPWHNILAANGRFGYFSPAMLWSEPFSLLPGQQFTLHYRVLVHAGRADAAAIEQEWQDFASRE